jgi:hypothetical protein
MNKRSVLAAPDENRIEELLGKIRPTPSESFRQKMNHAAWRAEGQRVVKNVRLKITFAVVTLVILSALFVTPQGRAWAQEIVKFFTRVNTTTIPLSEEEQEQMLVPMEQYEMPIARVLTPTLSPELAGFPECKEVQNAYSYACRIAYAESKLGFDLKEFSVRPEGWEFESLFFNTISKTASTTYRIDISYNSYSQLILKQNLGNQPIASGSPFEAVPADQVEAVKIGSYHGEYVKGGFSPSNDGSEWRWSAWDGRQRLAWSDGTRMYLIELFANTTGAKSIGRDQLIELAASLVDKPGKSAESLDPDFLYSISDAEKVSGLDLKAPTLLPLGLDFSSAQVLSGSDKVILRYGINDELVIHEWKAPPTSFDDPSPASNTDYEIVDVHGRNAFYAFSSGTSPYWFLWWSEGELNYQIYFYQYLSADSGVLNKEKMIAIAESMSDTNAIRGNTFKPYDYVAIYEQSLGFDTMEFQTTPLGWSFKNVSAHGQPACINISYSAEKEIGWLFVQQCSSDINEYFERYEIPRNAIERVRIGDNTAQYIRGNWEVDEKGKPVWNSDLPFRILRWQENGFRMQIVLSGDSILAYDKVDLISYAESLR